MNQRAKARARGGKAIPQVEMELEVDKVEQPSLIFLRITTRWSPSGRGPACPTSPRGVIPEGRSPLNWSGTLSSFGGAFLEGEPMGVVIGSDDGQKGWIWIDRLAVEPLYSIAGGGSRPPGQGGRAALVGPREEDHRRPGGGLE